MKKIIVLVIAIAIAAGAVIGFDRWQHSATPPSQAQSEAAPPIDMKDKTAPAAEPITHYPIPQSIEISESPKPIPVLQDSDPELANALTNLLSRETVLKFFHAEKIVRRIVATVDNLPREKIAVQLLPVKPAGSMFLTTTEGKDISIAPENATRYAAHVRTIERIDAKKLVALYVRFYPLFQQAYQNLGYPDGYFNDRLIAVIDHLLATPAYRDPINLVQPKVFYQFADNDIEHASAGHKILIRIGADNTAVIKTKLREIRGELTRTRLE